MMGALPQKNHPSWCTEGWNGEQMEGRKIIPKPYH